MYIIYLLFFLFVLYPIAGCIIAYNSVKAADKIHWWQDYDYVAECPSPNGYFADALQCDRYYECKQGEVSNSIHYCTTKQQRKVES